MIGLATTIAPRSALVTSTPPTRSYRSATRNPPLKPSRYEPLLQTGRFAFEDAGGFQAEDRISTPY